MLTHDLPSPVRFSTLNEICRSFPTGIPLPPSPPPYIPFSLSSPSRGPPAGDDVDGPPALVSVPSIPSPVAVGGGLLVKGEEQGGASPGPVTPQKPFPSTDLEYLTSYLSGINLIRKIRNLLEQQHRLLTPMTEEVEAMCIRRVTSSGGSTTSPGTVSQAAQRIQEVFQSVENMSRAWLSESLITPVLHSTIQHTRYLRGSPPSSSSDQLQPWGEMSGGEDAAANPRAVQVVALRRALYECLRTQGRLLPFALGIQTASEASPPPPVRLPSAHYASQKKKSCPHTQRCQYFFAAVEGVQQALQLLTDLSDALTSLHRAPSVSSLLSVSPSTERCVSSEAPLASLPLNTPPQGAKPEDWEVSPLTPQSAPLSRVLFSTADRLPPPPAALPAAVSSEERVQQLVDALKASMHRALEEDAAGVGTTAEASETTSTTAGRSMEPANVLPSSYTTLRPLERFARSGIDSPQKTAPQGILEAPQQTSAAVSHRVTKRKSGSRGQRVVIDIDVLRRMVRLGSQKRNTRTRRRGAWHSTSPSDNDGCATPPPPSPHQHTPPPPLEPVSPPPHMPSPATIPPAAMPEPMVDHPFMPRQSERRAVSVLQVTHPLPPQQVWQQKERMAMRHPYYCPSAAAGDSHTHRRATTAAPPPTTVMAAPFRSGSERYPVLITPSPSQPRGDDDGDAEDFRHTFSLLPMTATSHPTAMFSTTASTAVWDLSPCRARSVSGTPPRSSAAPRRESSPPIASHQPVAVSARLQSPPGVVDYPPAAPLSQSPSSKGKRRVGLVAALDRDLTELLAQRRELVAKHALLEEKRLQLAQKMRQRYAPGSNRRPTPELTQRLHKVSHASHSAQEHLEGKLELLSATIRKVEQQREEALQ